MDFVADESVDRPIVTALREFGHRVWSVSEENASIDDDSVFRHTQEQNAILITADKDFGDIVFRRGSIARGVILLRLPGMKPRDKATKVASAIVQLDSKLDGAFVVVGLRQLRLRPFPDM